MIYSNALKETIEFYTQQMGFTCHEYSEDWGWAALSRDKAAIMIARPNEHIPFEKAQFTGSFYLKVEDADSWWEKLRNKVNVCYEIENFDYGLREFAFYDNNGYLIQIGHELNN